MTGQLFSEDVHKIEYYSKSSVQRSRRCNLYFLNYVQLMNICVTLIVYIGLHQKYVKRHSRDLHINAPLVGGIFLNFTFRTEIL